MKVTQSYLKLHGWERDETCAKGVNRWVNNAKFNMYAGGVWASVTFKDEAGTAVAYAVINIHTSPNGYITTHRSFDSREGGHVYNSAFLKAKFVEGDVTVEELQSAMKY